MSYVQSSCRIFYGPKDIILLKGSLNVVKQGYHDVVKLDYLITWVIPYLNINH